METKEEKPLITGLEKFSTSDIIVVSLFGAVGIIVGIVGNIFHSLSGLSVIGPFILHTLIPGIVVFACVTTVKKPGSAILYSLIASGIAMPLMGVPIFIPFYLVQGLLIDGMMIMLKNRFWTWWGTTLAGIVYGVAGIFMLYYFVMAAQGIQFPFWVFCVSLPVNIACAIPASLIGRRIGTRAAGALIK
ncbi:MAG: hypothetical protein A4E35_01074 [Methanoregula sp. PtaU1.Bin051]|nr:MAG: hypothetical protein A4E35_01074 [Methanoregula sp. PtaU1.Bin051]